MTLDFEVNFEKSMGLILFLEFEKTKIKGQSETYQCSIETGLYEVFRITRLKNTYKYDYSLRLVKGIFYDNCRMKK